MSHQHSPGFECCRSPQESAGVRQTPPEYVGQCKVLALTPSFQAPKSDCPLRIGIWVTVDNALEEGEEEITGTTAGSGGTVVVEGGK